MVVLAVLSLTISNALICLLKSPTLPFISLLPKVPIVTGKQIRLLRNRVSQITDANSKYAKVNQDLISSSGLAGATLTELGRTISDMPYGIRGVTNNLSQLSTLFITLMAKTGGTTKALELLKLQLNGPLGIILAFQGVIAAIDLFRIVTGKQSRQLR